MKCCPTYKQQKCQLQIKDLLENQINVQSKNLCFNFIVKNNSMNNFYAILIFYSNVGHHHIELAVSLQVNCYI